MSLGTVKTPTIQQIGQVAVELGFNFNDADLAAHLEALGPLRPITSSTRCRTSYRRYRIRAVLDGVLRLKKTRTEPGM
jgi:hypothetical protein